MKLLSVGRLVQSIICVWIAVVSCYVVAQPLALPTPEKQKEAVPSNVSEPIYSRLRQARPDIEVSNLRPSPMPGLYKVDLNGQLAFVSKDGGFLIAGEMYQVYADRLVNLQEQERLQKEREFAPQRARMLAEIPKKNMVIYTPEGATKGHVYVFTDIDCGFCRKLHGQMEDMLKKGIEVRYLAFPRAGIPSRSAEKLATVWCSDKPQEMMTRFKRGENLALNACAANPIADHYILGQEVGVRGTPAIVLQSGQMIPGAVSPETLVKEMGIK